MDSFPHDLQKGASHRHRAKKIIIQKDTSLAYFLPKTFTSLWETYPLTNFDQSRPYVRFVKKCDTHSHTHKPAH